MTERVKLVNWLAGYIEGVTSQITPDNATNEKYEELAERAVQEFDIRASYYLLEGWK